MNPYIPTGRFISSRVSSKDSPTRALTICFGASFLLPCVSVRRHGVTARRATSLYARADDVVKLGELYRCGGMFDGKRIISEDWVNTVLQRGYELQPIGFGDAYGKGGMRGQMLAVFPSKKLSVCWTSYNMNLYSEILRMIEES